MTLRTNTFDGGTNGTAITVANSGASGTAFSSTSTTPNEPVYDTTVKYAGAASMLTTLSGTAKNVRWDFTNNLICSASAYFRYTDTQAGVREFMVFRTSANVTICGIGRYLNDRIVVTDSTGVIVASSNIAGHLVSSNNWYRIDVVLNVDATTATAGRIQYRICDVQAGDTDTPITTLYDSGTTISMGTTGAGRLQLGLPIDTALVGSFWMDSVRVDDGSSTMMGGFHIARSGSATTSWTSGVTATGKKNPIGQAITDHLWSVAPATGKITSKGQATTAHAWTVTPATGKRIAKGQTTAAHAWSVAPATGLFSPRGQATAAHLWTVTPASGLRISRGQATTAHTWTVAPAFGTKPQRGSATVSWIATVDPATGKYVAKGEATTLHLWAVTADGKLIARGEGSVSHEWWTYATGSSYAGVIVNMADAIYMGDLVVDAVYAGDIQVWPVLPPLAMSGFGMGPYGEGPYGD